MKTIIGILLVISSISTFAQFPEPSNFDFSYEYIMIDESGYCDGQWVSGPTYCSHFNWTTPDTSSTTSNLDYYNLYYNAFLPDTTLYLYATLTDTFYNVEDGFIGEMWVTAVYSNPDGESLPSNIEFNPALPISVGENITSSEILIFFDKNRQEINIKNGADISIIKLYDNQGKLIKSQKSINDKMNIENLQTGLYIIEIFRDNQAVIRQKIIK